MGGEILRTQIGLDLDQPAGQPAAARLANQLLSQQLARDDKRVALEESRWKDLFDGPEFAIRNRTRSLPSLPTS